MTMIKKLTVGILPTLCLVMALAVFTPALNLCVYASGYSSWIQDTDEYEDFYSNAVTTQTPSQVEQDDENFLIKLLGTFIHFIGAHTANDLSTDKINLTIDGVVLGRLAQPGGVSYTSFDLSAGNVYGTVGATVYTVFRGFAYSGMFLVFLYLLARAMFGSTPKAREDLKQGIYALAINYALIYLMPQITDIVIFLRDNLLYFVMQHLSNDVSILNAMDDLYKADKSLIKAIVYTATVFASLFYIKDYVSIAIQETVLFGFFCLFTVLGTVKKKYLADWCATFFSNLLVPLIDVVCLMLPYTALKLLDTGEGRMSFGGACVVVMMIWSARTTRKELLKLFGSVTNTSAGRGIAGLAHMAQMARMAHAATRSRSNNAGGKGNMDTYNDWTDEADRQRLGAASMNQQGSEISKGLGSELGDLDSYESRYGNMDTDTGINEGQYMQACDDYVDAQQNDNAYEILQGGISDEQDGMDGSPAPGGEPQAAPDLPQVPQEDVAGDAPDVPDYDTESGIPDDTNDNGPGNPEDEIPKVIPDEADERDGRDMAAPCADVSGQVEIPGEGTPAQNGRESSDIPDMTDFEKNRYSNLQQMDKAEESLSAARKDIDCWNNENAMMDSQLQDAREDALAETESDRQEIARLGKENASLDLLIQENDADSRQISTLQDQNKEIDKEIADERKSLKGTGTDTNTRIESLEKQRAENSQKIANLHSGMDERGRGWAEQADALESRRIDGWQKENDQIDRDIAAIRQEGSAGDSGRMRIEELSAQKAANVHNIAQAQSRIDRRSGDLKLEKARNTHAMTETQTRIDARNDALDRHVEDINRKKLDNRQNIAQTQTRIGNISAQLDSRRRAEEQYASISKSNGKDGRKYLSAKEMRMHVDQRNKRLEGLMAAAEKRGAISQDMLRDLSPEGAARVAEIQREAIRQSNLRHAMAKLAGGTAKAVAITAGAAVGSVVTMYGGEDASATGAMLGAMGAGGIVNSVVGAARAVTENREEILADMEAGKKKVSETASAFHEKSRVGHSQEKRQSASQGTNRPVNKALPPHEQVYAETLAALERNGRMETQTQGQAPDSLTAHEKVRDETMDAIKRRGGRSDS